jgi:hypothetical protein
MLRDLRRLHAELLAAIARLEAIVLDPRPNADTLARLRADLSRISRARYEFLDQRVYPILVDDYPAHVTARLAKLRATTEPLRSASREHTAKWVPETIARDWPGYQRASNAMRRSMRARVAEEMAVLYPLLEMIDEGPEQD